MTNESPASASDDVGFELYDLGRRALCEAATVGCPGA